MVVLYFSCNFDVVVRRGEPCLLMPPSGPESKLVCSVGYMSSSELWLFQVVGLPIPCLIETHYEMPEQSSLWNVGLIFPVNELTNILLVPVDANHCKLY